MMINDSHKIHQDSTRDKLIESAETYYQSRQKEERQRTYSTQNANIMKWVLIIGVVGTVLGLIYHWATSG